MLRNQKLRILLLGPLVFSSAWAAGKARTVANPRDDRAWKRYTNPKLGYCINYPKRWQRGNALDGAGIYARTGITKHSLPAGAVDVTAFADAAEPFKNISLTSDMQANIDGLQRFARVEDTQVLEQRRVTVSGEDALFLKAKYFDPRERSSWIEEIILTRRNGLLYRLELQARADQMRRFEPVFARFAGSFRFNCHGRR